ncbi:hypothetical protein Y1Q_0019711 [Alligator mississippiensis]|uniref:Uncharacterized protein n=1 Tax=Alligator mississippiensis TaxID=8496 RepID=A0A151PF95_ALLMI|nr:hypothetical protein Y1Q_0019711 [Alligator mississippiensis]
MAWKLEIGGGWREKSMITWASRLVNRYLEDHLVNIECVYFWMTILRYLDLDFEGYSASALHFGCSFK